MFRGSDKFEVSLCTGKNTLKPYVTGMISAIERPELDLLVLQSNGHPESRVTKSEFYSVLAQHSYRLGPQFQVLHSLFTMGRGLCYAS